MAASGLLRVVGSRSHRSLLTPNMISTLKPNIGVRYITRSENGAILPKPPQVRFGLIKVALTVTPFLLGGATISREFAAWLEEHELFVPDDDDD
ncbi:unnamed protein product [Candidula unifasciata]|uniref:Essential MCU regulator, mitochondrial n=1 Tax=Candidula unifasciata TaxID=100452 RepID=A0A8S3ZFD7_9EUPU|nr:unnamed protein product [Candidula unifasciata]